MSDLRITQLDDGLTVATERVLDARSVATGAWVAVGARDEPADQAGLSHFLEHLLFKGTTTRSTRAIATAVERVGGDLNAFTTKEYTAFHCRVPTSWTEGAIELLGDVLSHPVLRDADVESERSVILEELAMDDDDPEEVVHRTLAAQLFPGHPLGRETAGERRTVTAVRPTDVRGFFEQWYTTTNTVVAVAGPVDHDAVLCLVERAFADMRTGVERPLRSAPADAPAADIEVVDDVEQAHVAVGMRALARGDERREALDVLTHVLGGGPSSRLFEQIREERGLAYSVYASTAAYADAGLLAVYAGTNDASLDTVATLIHDALDAVARDGVTAEELEVAVGYLTGSFLIGLEDTSARMGRLGAQLTTLGRVVPVEEQVERWRAVTLDAVSDVARAVVPRRTSSVLRPG